MKVYVDTGILIDYLSKQALGGASLRSTARKGRDSQKLHGDAAQLLKCVADDHEGATSCFTYYELEEALHKRWEAEAKGVVNAAALRVLAARSIMPQAAMVILFFQLKVLDLTAAIVAEQLNHTAVHVAGVRAADALHVTSAVVFGADIIVSADDDILQLDGQVTNSAGKQMICTDSDGAVLVL